jgi:uncharacterized membrane protein SpoIIM required for sporulation
MNDWSHGPAAAPDAAIRPKFMLRSSEFRKRREQVWRELEEFTGRVEKHGVRSLTPSELQRLPLLYRSTVSSLSVARSIALDRNLLIYLENLSLRAYLAVYGPRQRFFEGLGDYLSSGLPAAVRSAAWHFLVAALAMIAGIAAGFILTANDEEWYNTLVPGELAGGRNAGSSADDLRKVLFAPYPGFMESFAKFANFLFQHNTMVSILTFATGVAAGVPTLMLLVYQGLIVGAFVALHYHRGLLIDCVGWLTIHGVTELSAIILSGAAGLMIAEKILFPGRYSRVESVARQGRTAALVAIGAIFMLFFAAILEGIFRQLIQSTELRFAIGAATGVIWLSYFLLAGREREAKR